MNPETAAVFAMMFTGMIMVGVVLVLRGPVGRALARRIEGTAGQSEGLPSAEAEELRHRVAELEQQQVRLLELEERLDFAERLLAQQQDQPRFPKQRGIVLPDPGAGR